MGVEYILSKLFRTCMSKMIYPLYTITNSDTRRLIGDYMNLVIIVLDVY